MNKDPKILAEEIITLVSELAELAGAPTGGLPTAHLKKVYSMGNKENSGPKGGVRLLIQEGKLDSPKQLPEIIELLRQEGRNYSDQAVSMGLLRLVKDRLLTRIRDKEDRTWKYVIRR